MDDVNKNYFSTGQMRLSHRLSKPHEVLDVRLRDHTVKPNLTTLEKAFAFQKKILIIDDINDSGATFQYILDNFGKHDDRIKFAALINNKPSKVKVDYHGYEIDKDEAPAWIVFPWEEWDK
jgi:hypoxanthine phosphoribosyltransferase